MSKMQNNLFAKWMHGMKISNQITLLYGGIFSLSLIVLSALILFNASAAQQNKTKTVLYKTVQNIEAFLAQGNQLSDTALTNLLENKYVEVNVIDLSTRQKYQSFVGTPPPFLAELPPQREEGHRLPFLAQDGKERPLDNREFVIVGSEDHSFMRMERTFRTAETTYLIQAFQLILPDGSFLHFFGLRLLLIDLLGILGAIWIGRSISRRMLRPVEEIRRAAERISIEDLSQRIAVDGPQDEMKDLTETFNAMISRLEDAFAKQNRFISDASHELRTPISVIQGYANLLNRWGKSDAAILQECIDSIRSETEHMTTLIKKLLFLTKGDQNSMHLQKEAFSLNELVHEVKKELMITETKRIVSVTEEDDVTLWGDISLCKQLLWIHTENALKFTQAGGHIHFRVYQDTQYAYVSIQDDGIGIAEDELPLLFDRFYRVDPSRNEKAGGTGLGLSIAHWIMQAHNGDILVESQPGTGTTFINRFSRDCTKQ